MQAPPHLHDLANLLTNHLSPTPPPTPTYPTLSAQTRHILPTLHNSPPTPLSPPAWTQTLYQSALLFLHNPTLLPHLSNPRIPIPPTLIPLPALSLLVLLHITAPTPTPPIRLTPSSARALRHLAACSPEAAALLAFLDVSDAVVHVAALAHGPAFAPEDLGAAPAHPMKRFWSVQHAFGFDVRPEELRSVLVRAGWGWETGMVEEEEEEEEEKCLEEVERVVGAGRQVVENVGGEALVGMEVRMETTRRRFGGLR